MRCGAAEKIVATRRDARKPMKKLSVPSGFRAI
jgi:hypothetical protein